MTSGRKKKRERKKNYLGSKTPMKEEIKLIVVLAQKCTHCGNLWGETETHNNLQRETTRG